MSESIPTPETKQESFTDTNSNSSASSTESDVINSTISDNSVTPTPEQSNNNFITYDNADQQNTTDQYVLNTSRSTIHIPSCRSVPTIAPDNYATSN